MKAAIYSPYLDTLGGGEKYMMTIAETLSLNGITVDCLQDPHLAGFKDLKSKIASRFNLNLDKINFINAPFGKGSNPVKRFSFLRKYDLFFYLTDGSIFIPGAKKNFLHIQSPLVGQPSKNIWGKLKLKGWDLIIYNSEFTRSYAKNNWPIKNIVVYPPVDTDKLKPLTKKKYILSVGRFFGFLKEKKHEVMIRVFKDISKEINGWSLHLAGAASEGDLEYLDQLKEVSEGSNVYLHPNLSFEDLKKLYGEASIYWHAAGFEEIDPTKTEHFGISTVEAMASGCVPIVVNAGGQKEIVENEKNGYLWNDLSQLKDFTRKLIEEEGVLREKLSQNAIKKSQQFSKEKFEQKILSLIYEH